MQPATEDDDLNDPAPDGAPLRAIVPMQAAGRRFDQVLAELFPDWSRSRLAEWIKSGEALLDGQPRRPRDPVRGGESVLLSAVPGIETAARPRTSRSRSPTPTPTCS